MARQLVGLARHSAIYGVGGLIARILAVVLLPLYTRYLTSSDYGAIGTLIALIAVLAVLLRLGTQSAFFRFYFDSKEPRRQARRRPHRVLVHDDRRDGRPDPGPDLRRRDLAVDLQHDRPHRPRPRQRSSACGRR